MRDCGRCNDYYQIKTKKDEGVKKAYFLCDTKWMPGHDIHDPENTAHAAHCLMAQLCLQIMRMNGGASHFLR